jgi:hypothetical protein
MELGAVIQQAIFAYILMAVIAVLSAVMIRVVVLTLELMHAKPKPVAAPVQVEVLPAPAPEEETSRHVAAVAAAVYAVLGAHRLVYIGEVGRAPSWSTTGRTIQHISHSPKRSPERR